MRKGKHRRHRDARMLKQLEGEAAGRALGFTDEDDRAECVECGRLVHAVWCRAEVEE
jgi:hypothetical protein